MKQYRIARISGVGAYPVHDKFFAAHPDAESMGFAELETAYLSMRFIYANGFSANMRGLGHESAEYYFDFEYLQKRWARERGVSFGEDSWRRDITIAQVREFAPDVLYLCEVDFWEEAIFRNYSSLFPSVKLLFIQRGFPSALEKLALGDLVFTCTPWLVDTFKEKGIKALRLNHAFDDNILPLLPNKGGPGGRDLPFVFAGSTGYGLGWTHENRYKFLLGLMEAAPLELYAFEPDIVHTEGQTRLSALYDGRVHPAVYGMDLHQLNARARLAFNIHGATQGFAGNMRLFEATGAGACLVTDRLANLAEYFAEDSEVAAYSSQYECAEKVRYLLEHPREREKIAQAGQDRVLREHTLRHRCQQIDAEIQKRL